VFFPLWFVLAVFVTILRQNSSVCLYISGGIPNRWYQSTLGLTGIICRFQEHGGLFDGDCASISERRWSVHGIMCRSHNIVGIVRWDQIGWSKLIGFGWR